MRAISQRGQSFGVCKGVPTTHHLFQGPCKLLQCIREIRETRYSDIVLSVSSTFTVITCVSTRQNWSSGFPTRSDKNGLHGNRRRLNALYFGFKYKWNYTVHAAKSMALISCAVTAYFFRICKEKRRGFSQVGLT